MYHSKRIDGDLTIDGQIAKRWLLVSDEMLTFVSYEDWKASPLPDVTQRDFFGGIIYA